MIITHRSLVNDFITYTGKVETNDTRAENVLKWNKHYHLKNKDVFDSYLELIRLFVPDAELNQFLEHAIDKYKDEAKGIDQYMHRLDLNLNEVTGELKSLFKIQANEIADLPVISFIGFYLADGWNIKFKEQATTFFALESIPKDPMSLKLFIAHELTHGIHALLIDFDEHKTLAESLFAEGLAVAASKALQDGFTDSEYLWVGARVPDQWEDACDQALCNNKTELLRDLELTEGMTNKYFGQGSHGFPSKFGYYIGFKLITDLLKTYSFNELIRMKPCHYLRYIKAYLGS